LKNSSFHAIHNRPRDWFELRGGGKKRIDLPLEMYLALAIGTGQQVCIESQSIRLAESFVEILVEIVAR
jgi:hypothetical protein